jgi:hypothetical protein
VRQVRVRAGSEPGPEHLTQAALIEGSVAAENQDVAAARSALGEAERRAAQASDPALHGGIANLRGELGLLEKQPALAAAGFDEAVVFWRKAGHYRDVARALARAGHAYELSGRPNAAGERYFRAARSSFAQGDEQSARTWLVEAARLAESAGDVRLRRLVMDLERELTVGSEHGRIGS